MMMLFDEASEDLHGWMSRELHVNRPKMIVRYLLEECNDIVIDLVRRYHTRDIDRFVLTYRADSPGNCPLDGVNLSVRALPRTITATAGTLDYPRVKHTFTSREDVHTWMCEVVNAHTAATL